MKILDEEHWTWMLFAEGQHLYLSVLCGTVGIYEINMQLTEDEKIAYRKQGRPYLNQLARQAAGNPYEIFQARHLKMFNDLPGIKEATRQWREKKT